MKNDELRHRWSEIAKQADESKQGSFDAALNAFEQMSAEIKKQAAREQEDERRRSLPVKVLLALTLISALSAAVVGGYGIYNYPDAPLRQKGEVYTGKHGQPRTREDYERFVLWQKALFVGFGSTFFFAFSFGILDSREKRRRKSFEQTLSSS